MTLDKNETKEAVKEAIKEWLDENFMRFGRWSLSGVMSLLLVGLVYLFMVASGWHK